MKSKKNRQKRMYFATMWMEFVQHVQKRQFFLAISPLDKMKKVF